MKDVLLEALIARPPRDFPLRPEITRLPIAGMPALVANPGSVPATGGPRSAGRHERGYELDHLRTIEAAKRDQLVMFGQRIGTGP
jgi:hypothetical protein